MSEVVRYTAGIPPLNTIKDPDTRRVLEALISGWRTRNGDLSPDSDQRFITKGELKDLVEGVVTNLFAADNSASSPTGAGRGASDAPSGVRQYVEELLRNTDRDIMNSPLWTELGTRIQRVDLSLVAEQLARVAAVQKVADDLADEAATRLGFDTVQGSQISSLEATTADQATRISGLTTRVNGAESTIIALQTTTADQATQLSQLTTRADDAESNITSLETTTAEQAQSLSSLSTRVNTTESNISTLNTTTANQANSLTTLSTLVNQKNRVFFQPAAPTTTAAYTLQANDLWYDSDDGRRAYRWNGADWVEASDTRIADAQAAISNEATTRANADNAITSNVSTQFSTVNTSLSALQTQNNTLSNNFAALSQTVTTLQTTVGNNTTAIQTEALARVNADNDISSRYSVKIDTNGYVAGFGLISTANNSTPVSEFIVRADKFAIGSASFPANSPDYVQYVNYHADVRQAFLASGSTDKAGYGQSHYLTNGQAEGRFLPRTGVPDYAGYVNFYSDLTAAFASSSNSTKRAFGYNHWVLAGQFEHRYLPTTTGLVPFKVYTAGTTAPDGTTIPPGVYIDDAYIANGTIGTALIGNLTVDTIKIKNAAVTNPFFDTYSNQVNNLAQFTGSYTALTLLAERSVTITAADAGNAGVFVQILGGGNFLNAGGGSMTLHAAVTAAWTGQPETVLGVSGISLANGYSGTIFVAASIQALGATTLTVRLRGGQDISNTSNYFANRFLSVLVVKK